MSGSCSSPGLESTFFNPTERLVLQQSQPGSDCAVLPLGGFWRIVPAIWPEPCKAL